MGIQLSNQVRSITNAQADSMLAPIAQVRLSELLRRNAEGQLSAEENMELDTLLEQVDQLTLSKTSARYTLKHLEGRII